MNPFDDPDAPFLVLANDEEQHSLWPTFAEIPAGWTAVHGPGPRKEVLEHIEANWADMRPRSLVEQMERGAR